MSNLELLQAISWLALAFNGIAFIPLVYLLGRANGDSPLLLALFGVLTAGVIGSFGQVYVADHLHSLESHGLALVFLFTTRITFVLEAWVILAAVTYYAWRKHDSS